MTAATLTTIDIKDLSPSAHNVRDEVGDVTELADSIRSVGLLQPLAVTKADDGYVVVAGHRRLAALKKLRWKEPVPVQVVNGDTPDEARMLVENMQRTDLTPLEQAAGMQTLLTDEDTKRSQRDVATMLGVSQSLVSRRLLLLELPDEAKTMLATGLLDAEEAEWVARITKHDAELAEWVISRIAQGYMIDFDRQLKAAKANETARKIADRYTQAGATVFASLDEAIEAEMVPDHDADQLPEAPLDVASWVEEHPDEPVWIVGRTNMDSGKPEVSVRPCKALKDESTSNDDGKLDPAEQKAKEKEAKERAKEKEARAARTDMVAARFSGSVAQADAIEAGFHALLSRVSPTDLLRVANKILGMDLPEAYAGNEAIAEKFAEAGAAQRAKLLALVAVACDRLPLDEPYHTTVLFDEA